MKESQAMGPTLPRDWSECIALQRSGINKTHKGKKQGKRDKTCCIINVMDVILHVSLDAKGMSLADHAQLQSRHFGLRFRRVYPLLSIFLQLLPTSKHSRGLRVTTNIQTI